MGAICGMCLQAFLLLKESKLLDRYTKTDQLVVRQLF